MIMNSKKLLLMDDRKQMAVNQQKQAKTMNYELKVNKPSKKLGAPWKHEFLHDPLTGLLWPEYQN